MAQPPGKRGDMMRDQVPAELCATAKDLVVIIKWKDIYQAAETVLGVCEDT
jgi:hypothetical protein